MMNFADFADSVGLRCDDDAEHDTVAGFVVAQLGRLPRVADRIESNGFRFEIMDMDGRRVDKVMVEKLRRASDSDR